MTTTHVLVPRSADIAAYRAVVQEPVTDSFDTSLQLPVASPAYPFVLAYGALTDAAAALIPAAPAAGNGHRTNGQRPVAVHLSQVIDIHRPPSARERLLVDVELCGARRHPGGVRTSFRSVLRDEDLRPVAELLTDLLLVGATEPAPFGTVPPFTGRETDAPVLAVLRRIPTDVTRRYAAVSGDDNPLHLDREAAVAAGFGDVIVHGMCVLAMTVEEVVARFAGGDAARVRSVGTRFSTPVVPGDQLEIRLRPSSDRTLVAFGCRTPAGLALKSGWVELAL
jgi:acyl dehydratase